MDSDEKMWICPRETLQQIHIAVYSIHQVIIPQKLQKATDILPGALLFHCVRIQNGIQQGLLSLFLLQKVPQKCAQFIHRNNAV